MGAMVWVSSGADVSSKSHQCQTRQVKWTTPFSHEPIDRPILRRVDHELRGGRGTTASPRSLPTSSRRGRPPAPGVETRSDNVKDPQLSDTRSRTRKRFRPRCNIRSGTFLDGELVPRGNAKRSTLLSGEARRHAPRRGADVSCCGQGKISPHGSY